MRRVMLLALLALALPTAALASSITYETGTFVSGSIRTNFGNPFHVQVTGDMNTIRLDTSTLFGCTATAPVCTFSSGTITVTEGTTTIFTSALEAGTLTHTIFPAPVNLNLVSITATIPESTTVGSGSVVTFTVVLNTAGTAVIDGSSATVLITSPIPEPGTLALLGSGLIGLAGLTRRKLKGRV